MRTMIIGVPRAGKTTLASTYTCSVLHTDALIDMDWSEASEHIARHWMRAPGPLCIEGVAGVRALRKFMRLFPGIKPCDVVIWCGTPKVELTPGQARMAKGCFKIWDEIREDVRAIGVEIVNA
jgi:hypothetical protein